MKRNKHVINGFVSISDVWALEVVVLVGEDSRSVGGGSVGGGSVGGGSVGGEVRSVGVECTEG